MKKIKKTRKIIILLLVPVFIGILFFLTLFIKKELVNRKQQVLTQAAVFLRQLEEKRREELKIDYQEVKKILTFAVIGDIHIGAWDKSEEYFQQALKRAKDREVEFVVLLGDLTQNGTREEFGSLKKILDSSGLSFYVVPGNHDIGVEVAKNDLTNFKEFFGDTFKEVVWNVVDEGRIKRVRLFLLDTARWRGKEIPILLNSEQWLWLKRDLGEKSFDPKELRLVFSQTPFDKLSLTDSHWIREFVCAGFVDGFFEADLHRTEFFRRDCPLPLHGKEMEEVSHKFPTFKVGSLFKPYREFPGFLIVHYFDNRFFEIERIFVGEIDEDEIGQ